MTHAINGNLKDLYQARADTALGFLHFARKQVDVAVIEVGLGGRFDSTNVCQPLLAIITSIRPLNCIGWLR